MIRARGREDVTCSSEADCNMASRMILLRCRRCLAVYENLSDGPDLTRRPSNACALTRDHSRRAPPRRPRRTRQDLDACRRSRRPASMPPSGPSGEQTPGHNLIASATERSGAGNGGVGPATLLPKRLDLTAGRPLARRTNRPSLTPRSSPDTHGNHQPPRVDFAPERD